MTVEHMAAAVDNARQTIRAVLDSNVTPIRPRTDEWDINMALEAVLIHAERTGGLSLRSASTFIRDYFREQSRRLHPSMQDSDPTPAHGIVRPGDAS